MAKKKTTAQVAQETEAVEQVAKTTKTTKKSVKAVEPTIDENVSATDSESYTQAIKLLVCKMKALASSDRQQTIADKIEGVLAQHDTPAMYNCVNYCLAETKSPQPKEIIWGCVINAINDAIARLK